MLAKYLLERKRANPGTTVLVHSGDMIGASPPESGLLQDEPTIRVLNEIGFDVGAPGNHEFDEGLEELLRLLNGGPSQFPPGSTFEGQDFPLVSANIVDADTKEPIFDPYLIKRIKGVRSPSSAPPPSPPRPSSSRGGRRPRVPGRGRGGQQLRARAQGQGRRGDGAADPRGRHPGPVPLRHHLAPDQRRHPALDPEVDVVMAGHSHTALNSRVDGRLVVQASSFGRAFEDVRLTLDHKTRDVAAASATLQGVWTYNPPDIADPAHLVAGDPGSRRSSTTPSSRSRRWSTRSSTSPPPTCWPGATAGPTRPASRRSAT